MSDTLNSPATGPIKTNLPCQGPDPSKEYTVSRLPTSNQPDTITAISGSTVTVLITRSELLDATLSFTLGLRQAIPWVEQLSTNLHCGQKAQLHEQPSQKTIATVTVQHISPPQEPATMANAQKLREDGSTVFRSAETFRGFRQAAQMYHRAMDEHRAVDAKERDTNTFPPIVASNLAMCYLRIEEWRNALMWADATEHLQGDRAKACYRRAKALIGLGAEVKALQDLNTAHGIKKEDRVVQMERARIQKEAVDVAKKRQKQFAETYSTMVKGKIFDNVLVE